MGAGCFHAPLSGRLDHLRNDNVRREVILHVVIGTEVANRSDVSAEVVPFLHGHVVVPGLHGRKLRVVKVGEVLTLATVPRLHDYS